MGDRSPDQCLWRSSELIAYFDMGLEIWRFRDPDISIARVGEVVAVRLWGCSWQVSQQRVGLSRPYNKR